MSTEMFGSVGGVTEALQTSRLSTQIRTLSRVRPQVDFQVLQSAERFRAPHVLKNCYYLEILLEPLLYFNSHKGILSHCGFKQPSIT